ncbi:MAG: hypothetical protein ABIR56_14255 [Polaromonas sp.]
MQCLAALVPVTSSTTSAMTTTRCGPVRPACAAGQSMQCLAALVLVLGSVLVATALTQCRTLPDLVPLDDQRQRQLDDQRHDHDQARPGAPGLRC